MDIMEHTPIFEPALAAPHKPAAQITGQHDRRQDSLRTREDDADTDATANFEHLLVEERLRRPEAKQPRQDNAESTQAAVAEKPIEAGQGVAVVEAAVVQQAQTVPENSNATGLIMGSPEATVLPGNTAAKQEMPAVLAQGLMVQNQPATVEATGKTPPQQTGSLQMQTPEPANTESDQRPAQKSPTVATTAGPQGAQPTTPAENVVPTTAADLESSAKGRLTYHQAPVVSESQLMADSLKNEAKAHATANSATAANAAAAATEVTATLPADSTGQNGTGNPGQETAMAAHSETAAAPVDTEVNPVLETATNDTAATTDKQQAQTSLEVVPATVIEAETTAAPQATETEAVEPSLAAVDANLTARSHVSQEITHAQTTVDSTTARQVRQQVVHHLSSRLENISGPQKMTIKLNPESLGQIELSFESKDDRLTVVISAGSQEAEAALKENLKDLTDRVVERSARFSHADIRVEIKDGADSQKDAKQEQKQDGRQDQRRDQARQDGRQDQNAHGQPGQFARQTKQAWENAMNWELADGATSKEG